MNKGDHEELITGIVLFIDIDAYMEHAKNWSIQEETKHTIDRQRQIASISFQHGFTVARTFGDSMLLFKAATINEGLASEISNILLRISSFFSLSGLTVKGSFATGSFAVEQTESEGSLPEYVLIGPIVNFAGKLLKHVPSGEVLGAWQAQSDATEDASYEKLRSDGKRFSYWRFTYEPTTGITRTIVGSKESSEFGLRKSSAESQVKFSEQIKLFILETTKIADDKAKNAFAISAALVVFLFNFNGSGFYVSNSAIDVSNKFAFLIEFAALVLLGLSCVFAFITFIPRQTTRFPRGLVFYGSISAWGNALEYTHAVNERSDDSLADELTSHNFEISRVSTRKFYWLRYCLWSLGAGVFLVFLRFFILRFFES